MKTLSGCFCFLRGCYGSVKLKINLCKIEVFTMWQKLLMGNHGYVLLQCFLVFYALTKNPISWVCIVTA